MFSCPRSTENHWFYQQLGDNQFISFIEFNFHGEIVKISNTESYYLVPGDLGRYPSPIRLDDRMFDDQGLSDWLKKKLLMSISFG
jgi:hypothetical protein